MYYKHVAVTSGFNIVLAINPFQDEQDQKPVYQLKWPNVFSNTNNVCMHEMKA